MLDETETCAVVLYVNLSVSVSSTCCMLDETDVCSVLYVNLSVSVSSTFCMLDETETCAVIYM